MTNRPFFVMTEPSRFDICYQINPWMQPATWRADRAASQAQAVAGSQALQAAIEAAGGEVALIPAADGLPDLVFPANAAIVLDGVALMARFLCPERQGEEPVLRAFFESLRQRGRLDEIVMLPDGLHQEGAGDAIWDARREHFWCGYGQRSDHAAIEQIERIFDRDTVALELVGPRFYHLDTCFCPLSGGEVLYYPPAFSAAGLATIRAHVAPELRIEATDADAAAFCVNAVNVDRRIVMARAPIGLRERLSERGYAVVEVDLDPFLLSGGAAYCMTLRLDRTSAPGLRAAAE